MKVIERQDQLLLMEEVPQPTQETASPGQYVKVDVLIVCTYLEIQNSKDSCKQSSMGLGVADDKSR